jgi:hypothetical protein
MLELVKNRIFAQPVNAGLAIFTQHVEAGESSYFDFNLIFKN